MNVTRHLPRTLNKSDCQPALHISAIDVGGLLFCVSGDGGSFDQDQTPSQPDSAVQLQH